MSTLAHSTDAIIEDDGQAGVSDVLGRAVCLPVPDWTAQWNKIRSLVVGRPRMLFAMGFDGILSPTVPRPREAALPDETRPLLARLEASSRVTLAFLSGRSIWDLQARIGLQSAFYVGNFGMEIRGADFASFDGLAVSCRADLVDALVFLARSTKRLRGVYIEDKGMTVTVHARAVGLENDAVLRELMKVIVRNHPRLRVCAGEACWDIRARASWNKADAVRQILRHLHLSSADAIYVGEEFTDEDAFTQLPKALTFCVGNAETTAARYRLPNQTAVTQLLSDLLSAVNSK